MPRIIIATTLVFILRGPAMADIDVMSDGSDGVFNPLVDVEVDLSLAIPGPWDTTAGTGDGVYDFNEWAVVFKYSSITIPADVTVTFKNHPSRAPVVWLSQGSVVIEGDAIISVDGARGHHEFETHELAEPGPGGFRGGRGSDVESLASGGMGPGGGNAGNPAELRWGGTAGSYGEQGTIGGGGGGPVGPSYGNAGVLPLVGGSGASAGQSEVVATGGGAGGGAIVIASNTSITVDGTISARGGDGGASGSTSAGRGGGGSGGAIRLLADAISGVGLLRAQRGNPFSFPGSNSGGLGGKGRVRVEGNTVMLTDPGDPPFVQDLPGSVFPSAGSPRLRATMLSGQPVPADPSSVVDDPFAADVTVSTCDPITLQIEAENIPLASAQIEARVVSKSGPSTVFPASFVSGSDAASIWTADISFQPGFSVVQARATFTAGGKPCAALPPGLRGLKTPNGERIVKVALMASPNGRSRTVYITEKGRMIPVDTR